MVVIGIESLKIFFEGSSLPLTHCISTNRIDHRSWCGRRKLANATSFWNHISFSHKTNQFLSTIDQRDKRGGRFSINLISEEKNRFPLSINQFRNLPLQDSQLWGNHHDLFPVERILYNSMRLLHQHFRRLRNGFHCCRSCTRHICEPLFAGWRKNHKSRTCRRLKI